MSDTRPDKKLTAADKKNIGAEAETNAALYCLTRRPKTVFIKKNTDKSRDRHFVKNANHGLFFPETDRAFHKVEIQSAYITL